VAVSPVVADVKTHTYSPAWFLLTSLRASRLKVPSTAGNPLSFNHENVIPSGDWLTFPQKMLIVSPSLIIDDGISVGGTRTMGWGGEGGKTGTCHDS
jgi:hypothetical protein